MNHRRAERQRVLVIFILLTISNISLADYAGTPSIIDTTIRFEGNDGLIVFTLNPDSVDFYERVSSPVNPFSPTQETYSAYIFVRDSSSATVLIKGIQGKILSTFHWDLLSPGAYKFRWWEHIELPSGTYFVVIKTKDGIRSRKALLIK